MRETKGKVNASFLCCNWTWRKRTVFQRLRFSTIFGAHFLCVRITTGGKRLVPPRSHCKDLSQFQRCTQRSLWKQYSVRAIIFDSRLDFHAHNRGKLRCYAVSENVLEFPNMQCEKRQSILPGFVPSRHTQPKGTCIIPLSSCHNCHSHRIRHETSLSFCPALLNSK